MSLYSGTPTYFVTALQGIRKRAGLGIGVTHCEGVRISEPHAGAMFNFTQPYRAHFEQHDRELIAEAVATARDADAVVLALRGFRRIGLDAGQSAQVTFDIGRDELAILDRKLVWRVEPGTVDILVGPNSAQTAGVALTVTP